jgi:hypothetical protein
MDIKLYLENQINEKAYTTHPYKRGDVFRQKVPLACRIFLKH